MSAALPNKCRESRIACVLATAFVVWSVVYYPAQQLTYAFNRGNQLTEIIDSYSEANTIRAGESYADHGFLYHWGLPDLGYGNAWDGIGGKHDPNLCPSPISCVYLHYPAASELVAGVMTDVCGKGEVACFRIAPIFIGFASLIFFSWAMTRSLGVVRCAFVLGSFYFAPMVTNGMHNLHYHSYVVSFLFVQLGVLLLTFKRATRPTRDYAILLCVVGFVIGWFSLDVAFHVALAAVPIWLLSDDWRASTRKMLIITAATCGGYAFAFLLHFSQVSAYLGSAKLAMEDFVQRAAQRSGGHIENVPVYSFPRLLFRYWTQLLEQPHFLGFDFLAACAATFAALSARSTTFHLFSQSFRWAPLPSFRWAFVAAFVIPNVWLVVMRQHGSIHGHFLPRNFIITFIVGALALAVSFRAANSQPAIA